jgi:hypothetical protein
MRVLHIAAAILFMMAIPTLAQQPADTGKASEGKPSRPASSQPAVKDVLESKVRAEWEAFKRKDKQAYGDLLADDFVAVEDDGGGARNKIQAVNEVATSNIYNYSMAFFRVFPLAPDAVFVTYEITMEFSPRAANRINRVLISELWLKRGEQWKARYYQETRVK